MTIPANATVVDLTDAHDPAHYGAKAATLAALNAAAVRVPAGKVLPAAARDEDLPLAAGQVWQWARHAGHDQLVARSSSPDEDGTHSSFAGIYQSCFIPADHERIHTALVRVRNSARTTTAHAYTQARGAADDAAIAVLIQPAARPAAAGVLVAELTADTLTAWRIEAVRGLAEPLATGRLTGEIHTGSTHHDPVVHATEQTTITLPATDEQLAIPPGDWINFPILHATVPAKIDTSGDGLLRLHTPPAWIKAPILPAQHRAALLHTTEHAAGALGLSRIDLEWTLSPTGAITIVQARPLTAPLPPHSQKPSDRTGIPAAPGTGQGRVVHLNDTTDPDTVTGSILVCAALDADAVEFLLRRPAALISTTGGPLSHTAIIARELCIPCVTNVPDAYTTLTPGHIAHVDGTTGTITNLHTATAHKRHPTIDPTNTALLVLNPTAEPPHPDNRITMLRIRHRDDPYPPTVHSKIGLFQPTTMPAWPSTPHATRDITLPGLGRLLLPASVPLPRRIAVQSPHGPLLHHRAVPFEPTPTHIVWDWNGTLLDDNTAVLAGVNAIRAAHNQPPITLDTWRDLFQRPHRIAYEQLLEHRLTDSDYHRATEIFNDHSRRARPECSLAATAQGALKEWTAKGNTQSLLSMTPHSDLLAEVAANEIANLFTFIAGRPDTEVLSKAELLRSHLAQDGIEPVNTVLIGDSIDDAQAANATGIRAILVATGTTSRAHLDRTGVPVVETVFDALGLLGHNEGTSPSHY
jgi:pyruvate,water dikinase